ncbi:MAG TPA: ABC transporter permease [Dehalococcoidia bacterium]|nr:ABC transporter permease [Dehalococcoidia bacterium]
MKAFKSVCIAGFKQTIRDRMALIFIFLFPIMLILVLGWVFAEPGVSTFDTGIVDLGSPQSAATIAEGLDGVIMDEDTKVFDISEKGMDEALQLLADGDLDLIIVVPEDMESSLQLGQPVALGVYYDPSQTVNQQTLIPILNQVIDDIDRGMQGSVKLIGLEEHSLHSHQLRFIDYLIPGILGMMVMFLGVFSAIAIIQQKQSGIIRRLGCTPLRRSTMVSSEGFSRIVIVLIQVALVVLVGWLAFDVQMVGNWGILCGLVLLGTLAFTSIGYLIAAFVKTEEGAIPITQVIVFPMIFLSGTFIEVTSIPSFIEPVVKIMPLTYLNDALRQTMVDGTPLYAMTTDVLILVGWVVVCLSLTIRFFKWD